MPRAEKKRLSARRVRVVHPVNNNFPDNNFRNNFGNNFANNIFTVYIY